MAHVTDTPAFLQSTEPDDSMELYPDNGQPVEDIDIDFDREETVPPVNDDLMLDDAKSDIEMPVETTTNIATDEAMLDDIIDGEDAVVPEVPEVPEEGMEDDLIDEDDEELLDFSDIDEPEKVTGHDTITSTLSLDLAVAPTTTLGDGVDGHSLAQLDTIHETSGAAEVSPQLAPLESADDGTQQSLHNSTEPKATEQIDQVPISAAPDTESTAVPSSTQYQLEEDDLLDDLEEDVQYHDPTERVQQNAEEHSRQNDPTERLQQNAEAYSQHDDPTERIQQHDAEECLQREEPNDPELRQNTEEDLQPEANASSVHLSQTGSADHLIHPHETDETLGKGINGNPVVDTTAAAMVQDTDALASEVVETQAVMSTGSPTTCTGLHPILCYFEQEQYPLFPLKTTVEGSEHFAAAGLLEDENLVNSSLGDLLRACRLRMIEEIGVVSEVDELTAEVELLGLKFSEVNTSLTSYEPH